MTTEANAQEKDLMTPEEVCFEFQISQRTLLNMVESGALVQIPIFSKINRYRREDIQRMKQGLLPYNLDKSGYMVPHTNVLANKLRKQREAAKKAKEHVA
jgi:hypothetical protein